MIGTANAVLGIVTFVLGIVVGYLGHDFMKKSLSMNEDNSKNLLILCVTVVWVISMIVSVVNPNYQVPIPVHGIMGAIVGFFFYKGKGDKP